MSSARRCSSRKPSSGRDCSRPRNMIVTLTLSPCLEEPLDVTLLGLVVVRVDLRAELHLFDDGEGLVAPGFARLLRALVLELAVVHELADGRTGHRGDLDQIQVRLGGEFEGLADRHDADLLALGADETDLGDADPVVDPRFGADGTSSVGCWCSVVAVRSRPERRERPRCASAHGAAVDIADRSRRPDWTATRRCRWMAQLTPGTGPDASMFRRSGGRLWRLPLAHPRCTRGLVAMTGYQRGCGHPNSHDRRPLGRIGSTGQRIGRPPTRRHPAAGARLRGRWTATSGSWPRFRRSR